VALATGTRIGPYEITGTIGAGGMGEVYRALDTTLDRDVAIKVLPELLAADPDRVARFTREAKTLASLNHANIAHIHGVVDSPFALVMEFVDGEDLAQRLERGAIPLDEAIPIAKQIADALECAHEQGIVHRDLKPANVKVRPDGVVKVLDFGLAKALSAQPEGAPTSSAMLLSPTFTSPAMTQMGIILGTAAYMAPEQARGKVIDKRADVWAFGVVLFEMLSGTRAFEGSEVSDTLAFVLTKEPDWTALPADTPVSIRRLLRRCLQKDRKQRLADISDARIELEEALIPAEPVTAAAAPPIKRSLVLAATALVIGAGLGVAAGWKLFSRPPDPRPVTRFPIALQDGQEFSNTGRHFIAVSRDGSRVVYTAAGQLHIRDLSTFTSSVIPGSGVGAPINPVFSPDGESVAFFADGALRKVSVRGGTPFTLTTEFVNPNGMFWSDVGIFAGQSGIGIIRVPESGGKPQVIANVERPEMAQGPQLLPDNDTLIFTIYAGTSDQRFDKGKIVAQSLRTGTRKVLYEGGSDGQILPTGHLVFGNGGVIYAVRFDPRTLTTSGGPVPALERVRRAVPTGAMIFRVAANGTAIYVPGEAIDASTPRTLGFIGHAVKAATLAVDASTYETPRMSPEGSRIAVSLVTDTSSDIWILDLPVKSAPRRLTFGGVNRFPTWSPDGRRIAFQSDREGQRAVYIQNADMPGPAAELLVKEPNMDLAPSSWSVNDWIAVTAEKDSTATVQVVSLKDRKLMPLASGPGVLTANAMFSPDGKWIAYSTFGGSITVPTAFVEPFPSTGTKHQLGQGLHPLWLSGGRAILLNPRLPTLSLYSFTTTPRVTYAVTAQIDRAQAVTAGLSVRPYDADHDGKRVLAVLPATVTSPLSREIRVIQNWFEELKK
jgi:eukaryotic-like serine/threonine-protein kinase